MAAFSFENSKGTTYYLHGRSRKVASGKTVTLYFFAKKPGKGAGEAVPEGSSAGSKFRADNRRATQSARRSVRLSA